VETSTKSKNRSKHKNQSKHSQADQFRETLEIGRQLRYLIDVEISTVEDNTTLLLSLHRSLLSSVVQKPVQRIFQIFTQGAPSFTNLFTYLSHSCKVSAVHNFCITEYTYGQNLIQSWVTHQASINVKESDPVDTLTQCFPTCVPRPIVGNQKFSMRSRGNVRFDEVFNSH